MEPQDEEIPGVTDDPVFQLLISGRARDFNEAEEMYLDASIPEILRLLEQPIPDDVLAEHPLMQMLRFRGSRGWEDSLL